LIEWTPEAIQEYCKAVTKDAVAQLKNLGCFIENDENRAHHMFGVELPENTTATPEVTAVAVSTKAQVAVTDAADVTSDNATERTTTIVVTAENGDTQEYKVVFAVKKITDVEVDALNSVVVYPNPATDFVQIANAEGFRITIMNSTGNVVEQNVVNSDNYTVDVSNLTRGIYLIKLVNGESVRTIKITVK
jgi:hypothetical protein